MKIVINSLSARDGGGRTYLERLLRYEHYYKDFEVILIHNEHFGVENNKIMSIAAPEFTTNPILRNMWENIFLPTTLKKINPNIYFAPGGNFGMLSPPKCKTVTMFRNMLPFDDRQKKRIKSIPRKARIFLLQMAMLRSMCQADSVIFISEYGKRVIDGLANGKIKSSFVVPHGIEDKFIVDTPLMISNGNGKKYLLYVSSIAEYKSHVTVLEAYERLLNTKSISHDLIFIGEDKTEHATLIRQIIATKKLEKHVKILGKINHHDLPEYYRNADINIFASECENCPNILLESLGSGRPNIVSNAPPMPEFAGDAVVYFRSGCAADLAEQLDRLIENPDLKTLYGRLAREQALNFRWEKCAERTWEILRDLGGKN